MSILTPALLAKLIKEDESNRFLNDVQVAKLADAVTSSMFYQSLTPTGYCRIPTRNHILLTFQWGIFSIPDGGSKNVTFPMAFDNMLGAIVLTKKGKDGGWNPTLSTTSLTGFTAEQSYLGNGGDTCYYFAVGK